MNRDDFFQQAMLKMAEVILLRTDKEPTPEQLAYKAKSYAMALHDAMLAGLTECDIHEMTRLPGSPPENAYSNEPPPNEPAPRGPPVLHPGGRFEGGLPERLCPKCGSGMKRRKSVHGYFWGCSTYPDCRGTVSDG